jgi:acetyl-CoA carboxylase carboxyl transferase subunit alpha
VATDETKPIAAQALRCTSKDLMQFGVVDHVLKEPLGGAHRAPREMANTLKATLARHLRELVCIPANSLLEARYEKYRKMGLWA